MPWPWPTSTTSAKANLGGDDTAIRADHGVTVRPPPAVYYVGDARVVRSCRLQLQDAEIHARRTIAATLDQRPPAIGKDALNLSVEFWRNGAKDALNCIRNFCI
jgi:hypothetical protein